MANNIKEIYLDCYLILILTKNIGLILIESELRTWCILTQSIASKLYQMSIG